MNISHRYPGQAVLYGAFVLAIGYFSTSPVYTHLAPDQAVLKLSFSHGAQRIEQTRSQLRRLQRQYDWRASAQIDGLVASGFVEDCFRASRILQLAKRQDSNWPSALAFAGEHRLAVPGLV